MNRMSCLFVVVLAVCVGGFVVVCQTNPHVLNAVFCVGSVVGFGVAGYVLYDFAKR